MGNLWVAVSDGTSNQIAWANDPAGSWTVASTIGFGTSPVYSVAFGNGIWVAGGASGKVFYSYDAKVWTAASASNMSGTIYGLTFRDGTFIAAQYTSSANALRYATDPTGAWGTPSNQASFADANANPGGLRAANGYAMALGATRFAYTTTPSGTWSNGTLGSASPYNADYGNGYYVAAHDWLTSHTITYATAPNGAATNASGGLNSTTGAVTRALKYGDGRWVLGGTGAITSTTDPTGTWTAATSPGFASYVLWLEYRDGIWVGGGGTASGDKIRTTTDPTGTWTSATSTPFAASSYVRGIAVGGGPTRIYAIRQAVTRSAVF